MESVVVLRNPIKFMSREDEGVVYKSNSRISVALFVI